MTQAFNLSQLANLVNTSGQLNAATGLFNQTPVANGGTGLSTVTSGALLLGAGTSAMTVLAGTTPGQIVSSSPTGWTTAPTSSVGGGNYAMRAYVSPQVWTKPGTLKAIKVTVVGGGGSGGSQSTNNAEAGGGGGGGASILYLDAPAIPGPITVTAGAGINSFGPLCSATAGANAANNVTNTNVGNVGGAGGSGSGGTFNTTGGPGGMGWRISTSPSQGISGVGGNSILGSGGYSFLTTANHNGIPGTNYGGGGSGSGRFSAGSLTGGTGAPGIVIVEEFY